MPEAVDSNSTTAPESQRAHQNWIEADIPMPSHGDHIEGGEILDSLKRNKDILEAMVELLRDDLEIGVYHILRTMADELDEISEAISDELQTSKARAIFAYSLYLDMDYQTRTYRDKLNAKLGDTFNLRPFQPQGQHQQTEVQKALAKLRAKRDAVPLPEPCELRNRLLAELHGRGYSRNLLSQAFSIKQIAIDRIVKHMARKEEIAAREALQKAS